MPTNSNAIIWKTKNAFSNFIAFLESAWILTFWKKILIAKVFLKLLAMKDVLP